MPPDEGDRDYKLDVSAGVSAVLKDLGVGITLQHGNLVYADARNLPLGLEGSSFAGHDDDQLIGGAAALELNRLKRGVFATGEPAQGELEIGTEGSAPAWHRICVRRDASNGDARGIVAASLDVTAARLAEEHLRLALLELSHRAKNLLAIVLSIARQTSHESQSLAQFEPRFEGRIRALAVSHDILTDEKWRGASVFSLARSQVGTFQTSASGSFEVEGYNAYLVPNAAQHVGLALHELATWSRLSGALSVPQGRITLECRRTGEEDSLLLLWTEKGIPPLAHREESVFGQIVLTRIVPAAMGATARILRPEDTCVVYELVLPKSNYF